jgi:hypothetical protein
LFPFGKEPYVGVHPADNAGFLNFYLKGSIMIDSIAGFLSTVVELLQTGINGLVDAVAGLFGTGK